MITRRGAVHLLGAASVGALAAAQIRFNALISTNVFAKDDGTPRLAPGTPTSQERLAVIEAFQKQSDGLEKKFEARSYKSDWKMPYRLFRPATNKRV
ncbi:MAG: hypothetical protein WA741_06010, partial [Candidatus Sulfotelmatobacter sp.]